MHIKPTLPSSYESPSPSMIWREWNAEDPETCDLGKPFSGFETKFNTPADTSPTTKRSIACVCPSQTVQSPNDAPGPPNKFSTQLCRPEYSDTSGLRQLGQST